jgi:hypothetical protein
MALVFSINGLYAINVPTPPKDAAYMLEEERMAMEVYQVFFDKWEHQIFQNISQAEERHFGIMQELLVGQNPEIEATIDEWETGIYKNDVLQNLYDNLVKRGSVSLLDALKVGAEIEELNITDLNSNINQSESQTAIATYQSLLNASHNHLRAFVKNIEKSGESYKPVLLDEEEYHSIVGQVSNQNMGGDKKCKNQNNDSKCNKSCTGKKCSKKGRSR